MSARRRCGGGVLIEVRRIAWPLGLEGGDDHRHQRYRDDDDHADGPAREVLGSSGRRTLWIWFHAPDRCKRHTMSSPSGAALAAGSVMKRPTTHDQPAGSPSEASSPPGRAASPIGGFHLGRLLGVHVFVDWSLLIIFALVTFSLGGGVLASWHPEWSTALRWGVALIAAVAFFASVLAHEMAHALVGRHEGIEIERITLFLFGGMAHMKREPPSPKAELLMAAIGPVVSIAIGILASVGAGALVGPEVMSALAGSPARGLAMLSPVQTVLMWLGPINVVLGVFNLIPGFPLDGGRVFRAIAWGATGDLRKATRWASMSGSLLAIALMAAGVAMAFGAQLPFFGSGLGNGLWLMLIGWFLNKAARASYQQLVIREALSEISVSDLMRERFDAVGPSTSVRELVEDVVMHSDQRLFPVVHGGRLLGVVTVEDAREVPRRRWDDVKVGHIMHASDVTLRPDEPAAEALRELQTQPYGQLPVVRNGELRGLLRQRDLFKWLAFRDDDLAHAR